MRSEIAASLDERAQNTNCTGQQQLVDHDRDGASCSANTDGESLEDLIRSLHRQIKDSDWLKENTAEKWAAKNPELAKAFLHQDVEK